MATENLTTILRDSLTSLEGQDQQSTTVQADAACVAIGLEPATLESALAEANAELSGWRSWARLVAGVQPSSGAIPDTELRERIGHLALREREQVLQVSTDDLREVVAAAVRDATEQSRFGG